jgi:hypothetical protein
VERVREFAKFSRDETAAVPGGLGWETDVREARHYYSLETVSLKTRSNSARVREVVACTSATKASGRA